MSDEQELPATAAFDPANSADRARLAARVRDRLKDKFGDKWTRQCGHAAAMELEELLAAGVREYQLAAGRVDESEWYEGRTGKDRLCRYRGTYMGTGESEYHVWLVNDATKQKIDCSELPEESYGHSYLWEPYNNVLELEYIEKPPATCIALDRLKGRYKLS